MLDATWDAAFRDSPYRLRFELGGETLSNLTRPVPRFLQAFDRARTIADALFPDAGAITAILAGSPEPDVFAPQAGPPFEALHALGFRAPAPCAQWRGPLIPDDPESGVLDWRAIRGVDSIMRDTLLWTSISLEMPLAPKAAVRTYLVDGQRNVMLHVYDDRGMDVQAADPARIAPLYRRFDAWLLDYDRPRMAAAFGAP